MTKAQIERGELKIGDFVRLGQGGETSTKCVWMVTDIRRVWETTTVADLVLVEGTWTDWNHGKPVSHIRGYKASYRVKSLVKVEKEEA